MDNGHSYAERMGKRPVAAVAFAVNVKRLMDHNELSQAELAKKTGVGQSTLSRLLDMEHPETINPRASTMDSVAAYFGVPTWQLLVPNMPLELLTSPRLARLVENYRDASEEIRAAVERIAELEVRASGKPLFSKAS